MENLQLLNPHECELCSFSVGDNGILHITVKDTIHTYEKQLIAFERIIDLTDGSKMPMLLDLRGVSLILSDVKAREYMARTMPFMFDAVAVIAVTELQKVAPRIFLDTMGQPVPIRVFDSEEEAVTWLRQYT